MANLVKLPHLECYKAVDKIALGEGLSEYDLEISPASSKGENYIGDIWRVEAKAKNSNKILQLIVKATPIHTALRDELPVELLFNREITTYNEVFKAMIKLQENAAASRDKKFSFVRCYYAFGGSEKEFLVLEDLKAQGFEMIGRLNRLKLEHARLVITSLAKFHALSFILQARDSEAFASLLDKCPDNRAQLRCFDNFLALSLDLAEKVVVNPSHKRRIFQFKNNYFNNSRDVLKDEKCSVFYHGDCWSNNILFKYQNGKPVEARLIDFQLMNYGPPAVDILYFLFTSTDGELRKAHYSALLDLYHETLSDVLSAYSCNVADVFPRDEFDKQVKRVGKHAFVSGIAMCRPFALDGEDAIDAADVCSDREMALPKGAAFERYLKKVTDIVVDCIKCDYI